MFASIFSMVTVPFCSGRPFGPLTIENGKNTPFTCLYEPALHTRALPDGLTVVSLDLGHALNRNHLADVVRSLCFFRYLCGEASLLQPARILERLNCLDLVHSALGLKVPSDELGGCLC